MKEEETKIKNNSVKAIKKQDLEKITKNNPVREILEWGFKRKLNSVQQRKSWLFVKICAEDDFH